VECPLGSYLSFFFSDTLDEFRLQELLACRGECPGSTTHESLCWTAFHAFWERVTVVKDRETMVYSVFVSLLDEPFHGLHRAFGNTIRLPMSWTLYYMVEFTATSKYPEFVRIQLWVNCGLAVLSLFGHSCALYWSRIGMGMPLAGHFVTTWLQV